jgi:uncharacterized protein YciI
MSQQPSAVAGDRFYVCRLIPPRPSFVQDMTAEEAGVMQAHVAYWTDLLRKGNAIVFGPVADPKGSWGLGVIRASDDDHLSHITQADPVTRSGLGFQYEVLPMLQAVVAC